MNPRIETLMRAVFDEPTPSGRFDALDYLLSEIERSPDVAPDIVAAVLLLHGFLDDLTWRRVDGMLEKFLANNNLPTIADLIKSAPPVPLELLAALDGRVLQIAMPQPDDPSL